VQISACDILIILNNNNHHISIVPLVCDFILLMCSRLCLDQEMAILKAEFGHHAEKLDEYEQMRKEIDLLEGK